MGTTWKIRQGKRILEQGTAPGDARAVLRSIMARELGKVAVEPSKSYVVEVGDLTMGLYGDEFGAVPVEVDEKRVSKSGYLVQSEVDVVVAHPDGTMTKNGSPMTPAEKQQAIDYAMADAARRLLECPDGKFHDMNDEVVRSHGVHARCRHCGLVDPKPCRATPWRDERVKLKTIPGVAEGDGLIQVEPLTDEDRLREQRKCAHVTKIGWRNSLDYKNTFRCSDCGKTIAVTDKEQIHRPRSMTPHEYLEHRFKHD
jgi:predicted RNA-binding Zn-ribbon protein involved in translation (DUF1610 family)